MKHIITLVLCCLIANFINAQSWTTVTIETPNQTSFSADSLVSGDLTSTQKNDYKNFWLNCYDNRITYVDEATYKYNCHAYAWCVSEGGSKVWIDNPNDDKYWNDCSYYETTQSNATKVSFGGPCNQWWTTCNGTEYTNACDHSAITTGTTDYFISKWGPGPRFRHHKNDCPYSTEDLSYYAPLENISGSDKVCSSNTTYSIPCSPSSGSVQWTRSSSLLVSGGSTGTSYTVYPYTTTTSDGGYVRVYLKNSEGQTIRTLTKYVDVMGPDPDEVYITIDGNGWQDCVDSDEDYHLYVNNDDGTCSTSNYSWSLPSGWDDYYHTSNMMYANSGSTPEGLLEITATTCCGSGIKIYSETIEECSGYYMIISPNPAINEATLEIIPEGQKSLDENVEWEMEVYSQSQIMMEKATKLKGSQYKIKTVKWKEGVYIIRAKIKDEILTGALVVKK